MYISVIMTTYNGEKYLPKQLNSILHQSRKADEIIICDDCSTDNTVNILNEYKKKHNLNMHIYENKYNKGVTLNFLECFAKSIGDIVFLCDQDDIWNYKKIEIMSRQFYKNVDAVCCGIQFIDGKGKKKKNFLYKLRRNKNRVHRVSFREQLLNFRSGGCCLAIRRDFYNSLIKIILANGLTHDLLVGLVAALKGTYVMVPEKLTYYRVHGNNASEPIFGFWNKIHNQNAYIKGRMNRIVYMEQILFNFKMYLSNQERSNLVEAIEILKKSLEALKEKNVINIAKNIVKDNMYVNKRIEIFNIIFILLNRADAICNGWRI